MDGQIDSILGLQLHQKQKNNIPQVCSRRRARVWFHGHSQCQAAASPDWISEGLHGHLHSRLLPETGKVEDKNGLQTLKVTVGRERQKFCRGKQIQHVQSIHATNTHTNSRHDKSKVIWWCASAEKLSCIHTRTVKLKGKQTKRLTFNIILFHNVPLQGLKRWYQSVTDKQEAHVTLHHKLAFHYRNVAYRDNWNPKVSPLHAIVLLKSAVCCILHLTSVQVKD